MSVTSPDRTETDNREPAFTDHSEAAILDLMLDRMASGLDQPELWSDLPVFAEHLPKLPALVVQRLAETPAYAATPLRILCALFRAVGGDVAGAIKEAEALAAQSSQCLLVQGAIFFLHSLIEPANPRYQLAGKMCPIPFEQMDVLDNSTHLCCASYLPASIGNLRQQDCGGFGTPLPHRVCDRASTTEAIDIAIK